MNQPKTFFIAGGLILLMTILSSIGGYIAGHQVASAKYEEKITALHEDYAADIAYANLEITAKNHQLLEFADISEKKLLAAKQEHQLEVKKLKKEISYVSNNRTECGFSPEYVSVYNAAIGAQSTDSAKDSSRTSQETPTSATSGTRVSQADVLEHIIDYGERCQIIETQLNSLIDVVEYNEKEVSHEY